MQEGTRKVEATGSTRYQKNIVEQNRLGLHLPRH